jgi:hypothetical protein
MGAKIACPCPHSAQEKAKIGGYKRYMHKKNGHTRNIISVSICESECKHFYQDKDGFTCRAFPKGIPKEIIDGKIEHDVIIKGQVGNFVFEEREE